METGTTTMEISVDFFKTLKIDLPHAPAIPLLGITQRILYPTTESPDYSCLLLLYSQWPGNGNSLDVLHLHNGMLFSCEEK